MSSWGTSGKFWCRLREKGLDKPCPLSGCEGWCLGVLGGVCLDWLPT